MDNDVGYCRLCGGALQQGAIASEQRACCLNATTIDGICPTHGPLGPHHVVESPPDNSGYDDS